MMLIRLADWLLRRAISNHDVAAGIMGDLSDEARSRPLALRHLWYLVHAAWIAGEYFVAGRFANMRDGSNRAPGPGVSRPNPPSQGFGRDLRHALRMWGRRPGFTALAVATLGLGIGATSAIVTVVDRVLVRPPPYPDAHELVAVWSTYPEWRGHEVLGSMWDRVPLSYPEYVVWRDGQTTFRSVAIYTHGAATLTGAGDPALIAFAAATPALFPMLGVRPQMGRTFDAGEDGARGVRVAVVSHEFWRTRLGAATDVLGQVLTIDGENYEVIGVLAAGFRLRGVRSVSNRAPDVWVPAGLFGDAEERGWRHYEAIGRLRAGVSRHEAEVEAAALLWGDRYPESAAVRVIGWQEQETARTRPPLLLLLGAAALLMAIASVNVATLFTAEAARRRHEFATRRTLGASRWQLARQLMFESGSIGLLSAILGTAIAFVGLPPLLALTPSELSIPTSLAPDARVILATALFGTAVGMVFGVVPSLVVSRFGSPARFTQRAVASDRSAARAQRMLVGIEAALAVVLVVAAGLLVRTLQALQAVDPGFDRDNIVAVSLPLSGPRTQPHLVLQLAHDLTARIGSIPGVDRVSGANAVPFSGEGGSTSFTIEGRPESEGEKKPEAHQRIVLPGFHEILGIPLIAGRTFTSEDRAGAHPVVVVSQSLADHYWPRENALGRIILQAGRRYEVIGIVRDILHTDLAGEHQATFYFPFDQLPPTRFWLIVRSTMVPETLVLAIRHAITAVAPDVALGRINALARFAEESAGPARYRATLVAIFGVCSLLLAAVGIFGVTARMVSARRRELGIRMALGARTMQVTRAVVITEARAVGIGVLAGLLMAAIASRSLEAFLYGVSAYDVPTFAGAALLLGAVGLIASYLPARRSARASPVDALRVE